MRIGIDLRALQIGHQFRGIGEVVRQACRQLDARSPAVDEIVAFVDGDGDRVPEILPELFGSGRRVTIVSLPPATTPPFSTRTVSPRCQAGAFCCSTTR